MCWKFYFHPLSLSLFLVLSPVLSLSLSLCVFRAAELMTRTGSVVTLEVAKQGAIYHGLATLLNQPSPMMPRGEQTNIDIFKAACNDFTVASYFNKIIIKFVCPLWLIFDFTHSHSKVWTHKETYSHATSMERCQRVLLFFSNSNLTYCFLCSGFPCALIKTKNTIDGLTKWLF